MARILNVSENNYRVRVQSGGNITLDTGDQVGEVRITGNLIVSGDYTTINVSNMTVEDNTILLNSGETGAGITEGTSGLEIDRGTFANAQFLFDESVTHYDPYSSGDLSGTFVLKTENGNKSGLQLSTIAVDTLHNLYFDFKNTLNTLEVINILSDDYAQLVFGDDPYPELVDLPTETDQDNFLVTKRYVKSYIASGAYTPGVADVSRIFKKTGATEHTLAEAGLIDIQFIVGAFTNPANLRAKINSSGLFVDTINLFDHTITTVPSSNDNLTLTADTNNVELDAVLMLDDQMAAPFSTTGATRIFSMSQLTPLDQTPGRTGIFYTNGIRSDELVSKNRALLFSILF